MARGYPSVPVRVPLPLAERFLPTFAIIFEYALLFNYILFSELLLDALLG
jgi:hypothetical protein